MKLVVPFRMPITLETGSPRRLSRSGRMSGIPPATAASNRRSTPLSSARPNSSTPTLARSSLLPVITGLPERSAVAMSSRAGSMPPITSITTSISGSVTTAMASWVSTPSPKSIPRSRAVLRTATRVIESRTPVRRAISSARSATSGTSAPPTLPQPSRPTRISRWCSLTGPRLSTASGSGIRISFQRRRRW